MDIDPEMKALRAIVRALDPLTPTAQRRVVGYLHEALNPMPETSPPSDSPLG